MTAAHKLSVSVCLSVCLSHTHTHINTQPTLPPSSNTHSLSLSHTHTRTHTRLRALANTLTQEHTYTRTRTTRTHQSLQTSRGPHHYSSQTTQPSKQPQPPQVYSITSSRAFSQSDSSPLNRKRPFYLSVVVNTSGVKLPVNGSSEVLSRETSPAFDLTSSRKGRLYL